MIVTSDSTALIAIRIDTKTGNPTVTNPRIGESGCALPAPSTRPEDDEREHRHADRADQAERLAHEDLDFEPGQLPQSAQHVCPQSRIEWPVSFRNTSSSVGSTVRKSVTRIRCSDRHSMTSATRSSPSPRMRDFVVVPRHARRRAECAPNASSSLIGRRGHDDGALGTVPADQARGRVDVDDPAVLDDRDAVAQALGLLHQMRRQEHGLAAGADAAHEIPDGAAGLRIEPGRQLVEKHHLGIVDERERDEQPLLLSARQRHEPGVPLVGEAELLEQAIAVDRLVG